MRSSQARTLRRGAAGFAVGALALAASVSVPASAPAAVAEARTGGHLALDHLDNCRKVLAGSPPANVPWSDDGVEVTNRMSRTGTVTRNLDENDITDAAATSAVTIRSTPLEAPAPASIVTRGSASASLATRQGSATLCAPHLISGGHAAGRFTLAQPTWVEITGTAVSAGEGTAWGVGYGALELVGADAAVVRAEVRNSSSTTVSALLPAGPVEVSFAVQTRTALTSAPPVSRSASTEVSFTANLVPDGHASAAKGKAKRLVSLGRRDCATGKVGVALTKRAVAQARSVALEVTGRKKAKRFQGRTLRKRTIRLAAPAKRDVRVTATVTLKNGKKVKVSRSYKAC